MKVDWAPLKVPPRRRLQTLAAALYIHLGLSLPLIVVSLITLFLVSVGKIQCNRLIIVRL